MEVPAAAAHALLSVEACLLPALSLTMSQLSLAATVTHSCVGANRAAASGETWENDAMLPADKEKLELKYWS